MLAQAAQWKDAKGAFEKIASLDPANLDKQQALAKCYLALRDHTSYQRLCESAIVRHGKTTNRGVANNVIWLTALMPDALRNYTAVVNIGRKFINTGKPSANECNTFGSVLYRAGQYQSSLSFLKRSIDAQNGRGNTFDWLFTAMALHKSHQPGAQEALSKSKALAGEYSSWWQHRVELKALMEEAEQVLTLPAPR